MKRVALVCCLFLILPLGRGRHPGAEDLTPLEELGKAIFFDTNLSTPPGQSCAACHDPATAFVGPNSEINAHGAVYPGAVHVRFGNRKPPAAAYATFSPEFHYDEEEQLYVGGMFWDGRALNVVEQAKGPFLNPVEMNNPGMKQVITKIRHSDYSQLFQEVFGYGSLMDVETAYHQMAEAIAAYEGSPEVNQFTSKYDAYLAGLADLTDQELHGLELFEGQGNCAACHPSQAEPGGPPPLFTDYTYDNLGVPKNPENPFYHMPPPINPDGEDYIDQGLGGVLGLPEERGKVKVPTLRNVGMRPYPGFVQSYAHNGFFKSLRDIVDFYNTRDLGGWPPPEVEENVNHDELGDLGLSDQDVDDIVAFLHTLTDGYMEGIYGSPAQRSVVSQLPRILRSHPNPFHGSTALHFALPQAARVSLTVHDPAGRCVRSLLSYKDLAAGPQRILWDGADDAGQPVTGGVYFYALDVEGQSAIERVLRLR